MNAPFQARAGLRDPFQAFVCDDALAPRVVETLQQSAGTGSIGDGKIFVLDVGQAVRIRTGETGEAAL